MGLIVAGAASTGGLAALAVKVSRQKNGVEKIVPQSDKRRNQDVIEHDRKPKNSVAREMACGSQETTGQG
jgi:hypothetical protein